MKQGLPDLQALAVEVDRQRKAKRDFVTPSPLITMLDDASIFLQGIGGFRANGVFHEQLSEKTSIPRRYYDLLSSEAPALLARNVNHWLSRATEDRMVRTLDGTARALLSDKFRIVDNWLVLEAVLEALKGQDIRVESSQVTEKFMTMKVVFPSLAKKVKLHASQVKAGTHSGTDTWEEILLPGVSASNSEVGFRAVKLESFIYTHRCTNGTVFSENLKQFHIGRSFSDDDNDGAKEIFAEETRRADDKAFALKIRDMVKAACDEKVFLGHVNKVERAAQQAITGDVPEFVGKIKERFDLTDGEATGVLDHLIRGGNLTQWGASSAVTSFCQTVDSYDRSTDLERVGGKIVELSPADFQSLVSNN